MAHAQLVLIAPDAQVGVAAFAAASAVSGSLLQSWIGGAQVTQYAHDPADDGVDQCVLYQRQQRRDILQRELLRTQYIGAGVKGNPREPECHGAWQWPSLFVKRFGRAVGAVVANAQALPCEPIP